MGRMVSYYIDQVEKAIATDIFQDQVDFMNDRFSQYPHFRAELVDILESDLTLYEGKFDTVICINVLEHLCDDYRAVNNMKSLLCWGGYLILLVPAWQKLYCGLDKNVGHYRRYDPGRLENIADINKLDIVKHHYFNMLGILPYWFKGRKKADKGESFSTSLNGTNSKIYNIASSILESVERRFPPKVGLTEVMILQKNNVNKRYP